MYRLWCGVLLMVALLAGGLRAEGDDLTEAEIEEMIQLTLENELINTERELDFLDYVSTNSDPIDVEEYEEEYDDEGARSSFTDKMKNFKESLKKKCDCESHRVCGCCLKKKIKIPKTSKVFKPKFCTNVTVFPEEKKIGIHLLVGPMTVFKKRMSLQRFEYMCKSVPNMENIEGCFKMKVNHDEVKGLQTCMKAKVKLMAMFSQSIKFPCFNFKDHKLSIDDTFLDDGEEEGLTFDYKAAYDKIKNLFGFGKKETATFPPNEEF